MVDSVGNAVSYITNNDPEQVGADIKSFVSQNWDSLKASHAEAAAKGPEAEAHWWGQVTGRAAFEVAAVVVPVTKIALLSKADKAGDAINGVGRLERLAAADAKYVRSGPKLNESSSYNAAHSR